MTNIIENPYDLTELVEDFYQRMEEILEGNTHKKNIKRPDIMSKDRKTFINNFAEVCVSIDRDPTTVSAYFAEELKISTSISANGVLVINNTEKRNKIEELVKKYITNFVQCPICKSCSTTINKINRINFLECNKCRGRTALQ